MPSSRSQALTPEALMMIDTIARTGSFAAAARELGKVPSALTYNVRQLEDALDVLLFDRSSRQAQLTAAGTELLHEGRRLLQELEAVANRVQRVACGWEATLSISVEDLLSVTTMFELVEAFCAVRDERHVADAAATAGPATRLRLRNDVLTGTWEALLSGQVDLAIGVSGQHPNPGGIEVRSMGELSFVFCVAPHHPLAGIGAPLQHAQLVHYRAIAVGDTAQRMEPLTLNLLPGQDVLTVPSTRSKLEALLRGLGCGFVPEPLARPHLEAGHLVEKEVAGEPRVGSFSYAWRPERGGVGIGRALQWWLAQLERPATRRALLQRHAGPLT